MVFSSIPFLYAYLPAVLLLYYLFPKNRKNIVLMASGFLFYASCSSRPSSTTPPAG